MNDWSLDTWSVAIGVISNIVYFVLGGTVLLIARWIARSFPGKRIWQLTDQDDLTVAASTTHDEVTVDGYHRRSTGVGEFRALAVVITSLNLTYRNIRIRNMRLSQEPIGEKLANDIILLGGPKNNRIAKRFLAEVQRLNVVELAENGVFSWKVKGEEKTCQAKLETDLVTGELDVLEDYGLIICTRNPDSSFKTRACLFAGSHTYGTVAAALYFTGQQSFAEQRKKWARTYIAIVRCKVQDKFPVNIHRVAVWTDSKKSF